MKEIYITWLDDRPEFISSLNDQIELLEADHNVKLIIDPHYNSDNFDTIARNIDDSVFLIDYNLKGNHGNTLDGNKVIELIRQHNKTCQIIFYSANATQNDLRRMLEGLEGITAISRANIMDALRNLCL